jgi:sugar phosphate isomerase/epimerase
MAEFHNRRNNSMDTDVMLSFARQGAPTSPQTPNQIGEMGKLLNSGMKNVEVGAIQADVFDTIPEQHFDEMRRLSKLTDSKISVHAPIVDPAGFDPQGKWTEESRQENEGYIKSVIDRSHKLDPSGNIPITIHSTAGMPGSVTETDSQGRPQRYKKDVVEGGMMHKKGDEVIKTMHIVDQDKGQLAPVQREVLKYIRNDKEYSVQERLETINNTTWDQEKLQLMSHQKAKQELQHMNDRMTKSYDYIKLKMKSQDNERGIQKMSNEEKNEFIRINSQIELNMKQIQEYDTHLGSGLNTLHHKYLKYRKKPTNREEKKEYEVNEKIIKSSKAEYEKFNKYYLQKVKELNKLDKDDPKIYEESRKINQMPNEINDRILTHFSDLSAPELFVSSEEFARKKTVETISNAAKYAYKKYGDSAPIISLENVMPTMVLSRGDSMKKLLDETKNKFAKELVKEKKMKIKKAKKIADKIIGTTWDVGHIHQLRKQGFSDKEIVAETKKIAKDIKHVHLTDNFGYNDSHLALGMGDVPLKAHLKEMEKNANEERRHIVESGAYAAQFKASPTLPSLEAMNSPIYTYEAGPSWAQSRDMYASYLVGYGDILPQKHFDTFFGGGFSRLPKELGGQQGGGNGYPGTPNQ